MRFITLLICALVSAAAAPAQDIRPDKNGAAKAPAASQNESRQSVTNHSVTVNGHAVEYTAKAGYITIRDQDGKPQADIFAVGYFLNNVKNPADRPITFAFNGGPGAASMWLHVGGIGPKRAVLAKDGTALPDAPHLVDNEETWLPFTDLVFVDPIGSGYSRTAPGVEPKQFFAPAKDIEVAAEFIRLYITAEDRWLSPKYIAGESYGTTRAAGLANFLQSRSIDLRGEILLSSVLSMQALASENANDLPFILAVPSFATVATYHKKAAPDIAEVEKWAVEKYALALMQGDAQVPKERKEVVAALAKYTGLTPQYIENKDLRVSTLDYIHELLKPEKESIGLLDARVVAPTVNMEDPSMFLVTGPLLAPLNDYICRDLNFKTDTSYVPISQKAHNGWEWLQQGMGYLYVADDLADAMKRDERFRVFAAAGLYDLTTPYFGQKYVFDHLGLPESRRKNLSFHTYPVGHQIYLEDSSRKKLRDDVQRFIEGPLSGASK